MAPGRYEGLVPTGASGPYVVAITVRATARAAERHLVRGFFWSREREQQMTGTDDAFLSRLARAGGGHVLSGTENGWPAAGRAGYREWRAMLLLVALLTFVVELAARRGAGWAAVRAIARPRALATDRGGDARR